MITPDMVTPDKITPDLITPDIRYKCFLVNTYINPKLGRSKSKTSWKLPEFTCNFL